MYQYSDSHELHDRIGGEFHRLAIEQEEAIQAARMKGSFVTVFIGRDGKKHYKACCDLTMEDMEETAV